MAQLLNDLSECEDIILAKRIVAHLTLKIVGGSGPSGSCGRDGGLSSGRGSGGGPSEGGRRQSKRKNASGGGSPSAKKGKMKV